MPRSGFPRRFGSAQLGKPKGHVTRNPPIYPVRVLLQAVERITLLPRLRTRALLTKHFGAIRRPRPVVRILTALSRSLPRPKTRSQRTRVFGHPTSRPPIRRISVKSFAARQRALPLPKTRVQRTRVFGHPTTRPPIYPIRVLLQAVARQNLQSRLRTHVLRIQRFGGVIAPLGAHVRAALLVLATERRIALAPRLRTHVVRTRVFGYVTRKPPVRPIRVLSFAARARSRQRFIYERALLEKVVRTFVPPAGGVVPLRSLRGVGQ